MAENYYTRFTTAVGGGGYTAGSGLLNVASTAGTAAVFRVLIVDQTLGTYKALLKVTGVNSGTQYAVTTDPGGTDANCAAGDIVYGIVTADALSSIIQRVGASTLTTFAGKAAAGSTGLIQFYSDVPNIGRDNGASFDPFGPMFPLTDPTLPSFAWRNQGGASVTARGQTLYLSAPAGAGNNIRGREIAQPSRPYSIIACVYPQLLNVSSHNAGLYFADNGSGKLVLFGLTQGASLAVLYNTSATAWSSTPLSVNAVLNSLCFLKIRDDATNFTFSISMNGIDFTQIYQASRTAHLTTPSHVGFYAETQNATYASGINLLSWLQGT